MVAYSFATQFVEPIVSREKLQTVRANRRRHARVGEPIQLYTAMRTKQCRKIVDVDPVCVDVQSILIDVDPADRRLISLIHINCVSLSPWDIEYFAQRDGFVADADKSATRRMGEFWLKAHGGGSLERIEFEGVCIRWSWPA